MNHQVVCRFSPPRMVSRDRRCRAFSLVELLTVMFIISALIAILVPSLNAARNSAKKTSTIATLNALKGGLDLFRNDNERQFARTNGYPPSFAHPRILKDGVDIFDPSIGEYPFVEENPVVSGAHWLPAMLMGHDQGGYINGKTVTRKNNLRYEPWKWYTPDPLGDDTLLERTGFYADPGGLKTVQTEDLPGRPNLTLFDNGPWNIVKRLPVIVDSFGQPILYYVANANGRPTNMVADERNRENKYTGGPQEQGPPFYFHDDNHQFTGDEDELGWNFDGPHAIARAGDKVTADQLVDPSNAEAQESFARFIIDRALYRTMLKKATEENEPPSAKATLRPVNADSYLLISAGVDGRYGTNDDITNFPLAVE
ncbi:MAG: prepilin-type N-terminal cleavage/methylation domain-containing protein [Planctomycetes bacterium]|nr:prepilin-type N-terminal cleavage/methylation domain-containing protein [Planctomycetota bacterium]